MLRTFFVLALIGGLATAGCLKREYRPYQFRLPRAGTETQSNLKIGDQFPRLETIDLEENPVVFDQSILGERYTLVVFWSTWCGWCMHELPHEIELSEEYKEDGLRVIGINADATREKGLAAAKEHGVPWLNLYEGKERRISKQLGISSWPQLFLLDSQGKVISSAKQLRRHGWKHINQQGDVRNINDLDLALLNLLRGSEGETLFP